MLFELDGVGPDCDPDGFLAPTAVLVGRVRLGVGASVWFGAVLRGDAEPIEVGAGGNVQDNAVLHTDPGFPLLLEADVTIGHGAIVHGCRIGAGTLVGMGAIVLNGARIGRNCLVAAGALVPEGMAVPDGSVVRGVPGRVIGPVGEKHRAMLDATAASYRERARRYRAGLRPIEPGREGEWRTRKDSNFQPPDS